MSGMHSKVGDTDNRADAVFQVQDKIPIQYVLYSHYANLDQKDYERWRDKHVSPSELDGIRFLISHFRSLGSLLTSPGYEGLAVLFYAPGLPECFTGIEGKKSREELLEEYPKLRFAEEVSTYITQELQRTHLLRRVRFVTALDLYDIFNRVNILDARNLRWWFIGDTSDIRYDTPKIVEAIVRLRLLGNGVPVFRLDWDVLFSEEDGAVPDLDRLFRATAICLKAYRLRLDDPSVATFIFSASYDSSSLKGTSHNTSFEDWRGAFATRVFPALPVKPDLLAKVASNDISWEDYAAYAFREGECGESLARRFYGLLPNELRCDGVNGLTKIGAHPLVSVISGAFLCLSEGAILDLPPFSNFSLNVSWIDDHLKYCLHRELRHLTSLDLRLAEPSLSDAKLDDVMVAKKRGRITNLPGYVLGSYLPTLLWGTIVDAWINPDPLLKCRPDSLAPVDAERWHRLPRTGRSNALLPSHLQIALETGSFSHGDRAELKRLLIREALQRISDVRQMWSELADANTETFASVWAKGITTRYFPGLHRVTHGIAPGRPPGSPITEEAHLNPYLMTDFNRLVEDALQYVDWTLNWPRIVHIVRSIEQGTVRTDMGWKP